MARTTSSAWENVGLVAQSAATSPTPRAGPNTHAGALTGMARSAPRASQSTLLPHMPRLLSSTLNQNPSRVTTSSAGSPWSLAPASRSGFAPWSSGARARTCSSPVMTSLSTQWILPSDPTSKPRNPARFGRTSVATDTAHR